MKRIYFALLLLPLFCLTTCVKDEENLFDGSAAERVAHNMKEYNRILNAATKGWLMEFYSDALGGCVFLCDFKAVNEGALNGIVKIASELEDLEEYPPGKIAESLYELKQDQGIILTFNTYNPLLHYFSEPQSGDREGFIADYEFTFIRATEDSIIMRGKKHGDRIVMTRFQGESWDVYLQDLIKLLDQSNFGSFVLNDRGQLICPVLLSDERRIIFTIGGTTIEERFIYTSTGIKLYEPVTIRGSKYESFNWENANKQFKCADAGTDAALTLSLPDDYLMYDDFIGKYTFEYRDLNNTKVTKNIEVFEKQRRKTYLVKGLSNFDMEMRYLKTTGRIGIGCQYLGEEGGTPIMLWIWNGASGIIYGANYVYEAVWNQNRNNFVLTFHDNGSWTGNIKGVIAILVTDAYYVYSAATSYQQAVMTKQ